MGLVPESSVVMKLRLQNIHFCYFQKWRVHDFVYSLFFIEKKNGKLEKKLNRNGIQSLKLFL
ncbi:hypothetical protein D8B45_00665 [Candidatus Gracilibacteria bacterium]|nr:MAG: hypothetical protein D8B45_00665 [Candidatus Gracilibacteria bacterium]